MKRIICLISFIYACTLQTAHASEEPVTISVPSPAIASTYAPGSSTTIIYTLTNNVTNSSLPLTVTGISSPVTRVTVANDCGNTLPIGPSTCNIGILIAPTTANSGSTINQNMTVDYQGRVPVVTNITFTVSSISSVFTAAGEDLSSGAPLLAVSNDAEHTWAVKPIAGPAIQGCFNAAACTGSGSAIICTAAGENCLSGEPILAASTDAGDSWAMQAITGLPTVGNFESASCTGSGSSAVCTAVGDNNDTGAALLVASLNGGNTWVSKTITGLPATSVFHGTSCSGSGATAICTAVGEEFGSGAPFLATSTDGANTWAVQPIAGLPATGTFKASSCVGSSTNALCIAVGQNQTSFAPLMAMSTNGAATWNIVSIPGLPSDGIFNTSSCTGSGSTAICIAAGQEQASFAPLLVVSNDGGATWTVKSVTGAPINGEFDASSCTGSGPAAICTAVGVDQVSFLPLLAVSNDGGNTWAVKTVSGLLSNSGTFHATSCTGNGSNAICTVSGEDFISGEALLASSYDGGNTWATTPVNGLPASGSFNASAATSG